MKRGVILLSTLVMLVSIFSFLSCETTDTLSSTPESRGDNLYLWCSSKTVLANIYAGNGRVVRSFDAPGNEPSGLAFDGTCLWNADNQTESLYRIDLSAGIPIVTMNTPGGKSSGLAWDGDYLWSIHNSLEKIDTYSGGTVESHNVGGSGLAWDGHHLWTSHNKFIFGDIDYYQCYLDKIDPDTGNIIESFLFSSEQCDYPAYYDNTNIQGLAWYNGDIWYSMTHSKFLAHDPDDPSQGGTYANHYYIGYFDLKTETDNRLFLVDFPLNGMASNGL